MARDVERYDYEVFDPREVGQPGTGTRHRQEHARVGSGAARAQVQGLKSGAHKTELEQQQQVPASNPHVLRGARGREIAGRSQGRSQAGTQRHTATHSDTSDSLLCAAAGVEASAEAADG
jgi:hypothetical protein